MWGITAEVSGGIEEAVERQRIKYKNRSSIDPPGVEELSRRQEKPNGKNPTG